MVSVSALPSSTLPVLVILLTMMTGKSTCLINHSLPYATSFILAGNQSLRTLKPVLTHISNKKTASTGKNSWIIVFMPVCTSSSRRVTREHIFIDVAYISVTKVSRSLKPLDIEFMRRLHTKVNLIPVIAKADTLTDDEVAEFKARVS
jgi:hypothetical protein